MIFLNEKIISSVGGASAEKNVLFGPKMNRTIAMIFEAFIEKIERDFRRQHQADEAKALREFPDFATRELLDFQYNLDLDQFDDLISHWLLKTPQLPEQINVHNTFGEPPITIYHGGNFVIDVYIWIGADTSIHSHGFRGAFRVLHGQSLHETYSVKVIESIAPDVEITELEMVLTETLKRGDVRTIEPGKALTHRVVHLEGPTVTLCVKTIGEKSLSQWHHFQNGLAIQKRHLEASLIKKIYYFQYLAGRNGESNPGTISEKANQFVDQILGKEDISTLMNLCEELSMGSYQISEELVQFILEKTYAKFDGAEWFRRYQESLEEVSQEVMFVPFETPLARLSAHFQNLDSTLIPSASRELLIASLE